MEGCEIASRSYSRCASSPNFKAESCRYLKGVAFFGAHCSWKSCRNPGSVHSCPMLPPKKTVIKSRCSTSKSQQLVAYVTNLKLITSTHHLLFIADVLLPACDCLSTTAGRFRRLWRVEVSQGPSVQRSAIFAASCGVQSQKSEHRS